VNKAAFRRALLPLLDDRTDGAIEFKHQNISAVLIDLGVPYISGYKPAFNYQNDLRTVVVGQLEARRVLRELVAQSVQAVPTVLNAADPTAVFTDVPPPREPSRTRRESTSHRAPVDYVQMEARNSALGLAGERFVIDLERERLERAGRSQLAAQVSHVSVEKGDGVGYDILSFEPNSREKLIEVKTTKYGEYTPFFLTRNELSTSQQHAQHYHLYRVFSFGTNSKVFALSVALDISLQLETANYIARVG
jgi:hypothetical protein